MMLELIMVPNYVVSSHIVAKCCDLVRKYELNLHNIKKNSIQAHATNNRVLVRIHDNKDLICNWILELIAKIYFYFWYFWIIDKNPRIMWWYFFYGFEFCLTMGWVSFKSCLVWNLPQYIKVLHLEWEWSNI